MLTNMKFTLITLFIFLMFSQPQAYSMWSAPEGSDLKTLEIELILPAFRGDPQAQYQYASVLYANADLYANEEKLYKARTFFKKAADQNHLEAIYDYAIMCTKGEGGEALPEEAFQMLEKGIQVYSRLPDINTHLYNIGAKIFFEYARMLDQGRGCTQDFEKAFKNYEIAAHMKHPGAISHLADRLS